MKISYKILWIEDHFKEVKPFISNLSSKLKNLGFILEVEKISTFTGSDLSDLSDKLSIYNPYDIIFFDYDLGDAKGDDVAYQLRTAIYTDMIFYSGTKGSELRKILFDKNVEGVYTVDRGNFVNETWPIIEDQIKRICDINNMRGVLLDEMSKIDLEMRKMYKTKFDNADNTKQNNQIKRFKKNLITRKDNIEKQVSDIELESFSDMFMKPTKVEFDIVRNRLKSITESEIFENTGELKLKQDLRNKFAHNTAKYDDVKGTVSLVGYSETYNFDDFTQIRKELIDLLSTIEDI